MLLFSKFLGSKFSGYLAIIQLLAIIAAVLAVYWYGYGECKEDQIIKTIKVTEKRNEIANNPVDAAGLSERLRDNSY